jgi:hypothetical protein
VDLEGGPAGPRLASSGSAFGAIQCIAVFRPAPTSTQRPRNPPRPPGVLKRNSTGPAESALPSAMTFDDCHPVSADNLLFPSSRQEHR